MRDTRFYGPIGQCAYDPNSSVSLARPAKLDAEGTHVEGPPEGREDTYGERHPNLSAYVRRALTLRSQCAQYYLHKRILTLTFLS